MLARINQIQNSIRKYGLLNFVLRYFGDLVNNLYRYQVATVFVLRPSTELQFDLINMDLKIEVISFPIDSSLRQFINTYLPEKELESRIENGWGLCLHEKIKLLWGGVGFV